MGNNRNNDNEYKPLRMRTGYGVALPAEQPTVTPGNATDKFINYAETMGFQIKTLPDYIREKQLGKGAFGKVERVRIGSQTKAMKSILEEADNKTPVALINEASIDLINEAAISNTLVNETNATLFVAQELVFENKKPRLLANICARGDLKGYAEESSALFDNDLDIDDLLNQIDDIEKALTHSNVVHRDIACRNFLLDEENGKLKVKLGDFGMAGELSAGIHKAGKATCPLRSTSPAALRTLEFSHATDSYSILVAQLELITLMAGKDIPNIQSDKPNVSWAMDIERDYRKNPQGALEKMSKSLETLLESILTTENITLTDENKRLKEMITEENARGIHDQDLGKISLQENKITFLQNKITFLNKLMAGQKKINDKVSNYALKMLDQSILRQTFLHEQISEIRSNNPEENSDELRNMCAELIRLNKEINDNEVIENALKKLSPSDQNGYRSSIQSLKEFFNDPAYKTFVESKSVQLSANTSPLRQEINNLQKNDAAVGHSGLKPEIAKPDETVINNSLATYAAKVLQLLEEYYPKHAEPGVKIRHEEKKQELLSLAFNNQWNLSPTSIIEEQSPTYKLLVLLREYQTHAGELTVEYKNSLVCDTLFNRGNATAALHLMLTNDENHILQNEMDRLWDNRIKALPTSLENLADIKHYLTQLNHIMQFPVSLKKSSQPFYLAFQMMLEYGKLLDSAKNETIEKLIVSHFKSELVLLNLKEQTISDIFYPLAIYNRLDIVKHISQGKEERRQALEQFTTTNRVTQGKLSSNTIHDSIHNLHSFNTHILHDELNKEFALVRKKMLNEAILNLKKSFDAHAIDALQTTAKQLSAQPDMQEYGAQYSPYETSCLILKDYKELTDSMSRANNTSAVNYLRSEEVAQLIKNEVVLLANNIFDLNKSKISEKRELISDEFLLTALHNRLTIANHLYDTNDKKIHYIAFCDIIKITSESRSELIINSPIRALAKAISEGTAAPDDFSHLFIEVQSLIDTLFLKNAKAISQPLTLRQELLVRLPGQTLPKTEIYSSQMQNLLALPASNEIKRTPFYETIKDMHSTSDIVDNSMTSFRDNLKETALKFNESTDTFFLHQFNSVLQNFKIAVNHKNSNSAFYYLRQNLLALKDLPSDKLSNKHSVAHKTFHDLLAIVNKNEYRDIFDSNNVVSQEQVRSLTSILNSHINPCINELATHNGLQDSFKHALHQYRMSDRKIKDITLFLTTLYDAVQKPLSDTVDNSIYSACKVLLSRFNTKEDIITSLNDSANLLLITNQCNALALSSTSQKFDLTAFVTQSIYAELNLHNMNEVADNKLRTNISLLAQIHLPEQQLAHSPSLEALQEALGQFHHHYCDTSNNSLAAVTTLENTDIQTLLNAAIAQTDNDFLQQAHAAFSKFDALTKSQSSSKPGLFQQKTSNQNPLSIFKKTIHSILTLPTSADLGDVKNLFTPDNINESTLPHLQKQFNSMMQLRFEAMVKDALATYKAALNTTAQEASPSVPAILINRQHQAILEKNLANALSLPIANEFKTTHLYASVQEFADMMKEHKEEFAEKISALMQIAAAPKPVTQLITAIASDPEDSHQKTSNPFADSSKSQTVENTQEARDAARNKINSELDPSYTKTIASPATSTQSPDVLATSPASESTTHQQALVIGTRITNNQNDTFIKDDDVFFNDQHQLEIHTQYRATGADATQAALSDMLDCTTQSVSLGRLKSNVAIPSANLLDSCAQTIAESLKISPALQSKRHLYLAQNLASCSSMVPSKAMALCLSLADFSVTWRSPFEISKKEVDGFRMWLQTQIDNKQLSPGLMALLPYTKKYGAKAGEILRKSEDKQRRMTN